MKRDNGKILLALAPHRVPADAAVRISAAGGGRDVLILSDKDAIAAAAVDLEIVAGDFPPSLLASCPRLRWFQLWYAGADWLQKFPETVDLPFLVSTASGIHGEQMTEHLFGLLFAWNRKLKATFAAQDRGEWAKYGHGDMDVLAGKTMLILGYGTIGERIAAAARVFGMEVVGVRRTPPASGRDGQGVRVLGLEALDSLLPAADHVVNILPLTQDTRASFGAARFAAMKRSAVFSNIGRGGTVDEGAMIEALAERRIAGALLDVTSEEPLPSSSPLWKLDNVLLTPHYSGFHPRYDELALGVFLDNLGRYHRGETLRNLVDKRKGY